MAVRRQVCVFQDSSSMFVVILLLWSGIVELLFNQNQLSHAYLYSFSLGQ